MELFPEYPPLFPDIHTKNIKEYFKSLSSKEPESRLSKNIKEYFKSLSSKEPQSRLSNTDLVKLRGAYFLCFTNRCGSNYVAQAIASDGKLAQAGENLNFDTVIEQSERLGYSSFAEYFSWLANAGKGKEKIFGCKTSVGQLLFLYNEGLLSLFASKPKFIHVVRKDVIAQAASLYIASKTNQWTSEQPVNDTPIMYDKEALISIIRSICLQNAAFESIFQLFGIQPLVVYYEDFIDSPRQWIKIIGNFLEVDDLAYVDETIRYNKQADQKNEALISRIRHEFKL